MLYRATVFLFLGLFCSVGADASRVLNSDYLFFSDNSQAVSWYKNSPSAKFSGNVVDVNDLRHGQAKAKIDKIWKGFQDLFPEKTLNTRAPFPVIVESDMKDALVMVDQATQAIPQIIKINTGLFASATDDQWYGLIAHELTHYVFKHGLNGTENRVWKFYQSTGIIEPVGSQQSDNLGVRKVVLDWMGHLQWSGAILTGKLHGFALPSQGSGITYFIFQYLAAREKTNHPKECSSFARDQANMVQIFLKSYSYVTGDLDLSPSESDQMNALSAGLGGKAKGCFGSVTEKMDDLIREVAGSGIKIDPADKALYESENSTLDGLMSLVNHHAQLALTLQKLHQSDWGKFRYYSHEEEADLTAVRVLDALGLKADGQADLFWSLLPVRDQTQCSSYLNSGKIPPYGILSDPHHSLCFRIFNIRRAKAQLKASL